MQKSEDDEDERPEGIDVPKQYPRFPTAQNIENILSSIA